MPPSTITGALHPSNRDAIAWNEKGIIAFGCHSTLVLLDVRRLEVFQTLEQHTTAINQVCWKPPSSELLRPEEAQKEEQLRCASSDISGNIFIWDVLAGTVCASFRHATTHTTDIKWIRWPNLDKDMLLSLHSNTWLILWDIDKQERLWEHKFAVPIYKTSLDPFDVSKMALTSTGASLLLVEDLSAQRWTPTDGSIPTLTLEPRTVPHSKGSTESAIVQLRHHGAFEHLLFVLFPNEICLVHTQNRQVLYSAIIDTGSPIVQVLSCARRDAIFLVHQNGLVSFRLARMHISEERVSASLDYERHCTAESMHRQSARLRVVGAVLCPATNSTFALLMNSGRALIYQLEKAKQCIEPYRIRSLIDLVQLDPECQSSCQQLRLTQYGCYSPLSNMVTVVRMRPINCPSNVDDAVQQTADIAGTAQLDGIGQLAAVGTTTGIIHLLDVFSGRILRNFQVQTCPVKCLEWAGANAIVSAAFIASLSSSNTVRNNIIYLDIRTGAKHRIRPEQEESPVEAIRVSHYSQYLAISFRDNPLEIWDLTTQCLLRRMSKRCPIIVDMCWSGKHHQVKTVNERTRIYRENLVVLDNDNHLYHVVVKGLHVRDGKEVSTQWKSGAAFLRCMVWKDDVLAFGDSAGRVGVWDLGKSQCRQSGLSQSTRGPVQRCVFSKLAGDYSLAAQHPTSLVVWDTEKLHVVFSVQRPGLSIIDVDMCGLTPVYISSDGMFRIALHDSTEKGHIDSNKHIINELDIPQLLKPDFCQALKSVAYGNNENEKMNMMEKDDPEMSNFLKRIQEFGEDRIARLAFAYQFTGLLAFADFCQVVHSKIKARRKKEENEEIDEQLSTDLMLFWEKKAYAKRVEQLTRLLLSTCRNERQLEQAIEKCIVMKKNELAMYYLLNNEQQPAGANREEIRLNAFRACVFSANFDSEESKCLVKLTATNLIASNFVSEGIQLLSLIDQGLDACKYLISQGLWQSSLIYAKINPNCDFVEVYNRYAEHLESEMVRRKSLALMVLASLENWERCRTLIGANQEEIANILDIASPIPPSQM